MSTPTSRPEDDRIFEEAAHTPGGLGAFTGVIVGESQVCRFLADLLGGLGMTVTRRKAAHDLRNDSAASPAEERRDTDLADGKDVLVFVGSAAQRDAHGLDAQAVRTVNPDIIYVHIDDGGHSQIHLPLEDSRERTTDPLLAAELGAVLGFSDPDVPRSVEIPVVDFAAAMSASLSIAAALTSEGGSSIEMSPETALGLLTVDSLTQAMVDGDAVARTTRHPQGQIFVAECACGTGLTVQNSSSQQFWERFATSLGRADLINSPRYADYHDRVRNYFELETIIRAEVARRTAQEWSEILLASDVPFSPLFTPAQALSHPQVAALDLLRTPSVPTGPELLRPLRFEGQRHNGTGTEASR